MEQCRVFSLLGELRLVYFIEDINGYYSLREKPIERDITVIDELWEYISSLNNSQYTEEELEALEEIYPIVRYKFNKETSRWEYIEYSSSIRVKRSTKIPFDITYNDLIT